MGLEEIYKESIKLAGLAEILKSSLSQHNPGIDSNNRIPLSVLAADCGTLVVGFGKLKSELNKVEL